MSTCSRCGTTYSCGVADGKSGPCWCASLPAVLPVPGLDASCWCPACLQASLAARTEGGAGPSLPPSA